MNGVGRLLPLALFAAFLGACGSDEEGEPIPQGIAGDVETQLELIQNRVDNGSPGACADIEKSDDGGTFAEVDRQVEAIPEDVDADVVDALRQSVERLKELVRQECDEISEKTETTEEPTDIPPVEEVPTITVPPETTPTETVPEDEQDGGTEIPPGQEKKQDQGQGQGQGQFDSGGEPGGGVVVPEGE